ncbi:MAG TPA: antitoxin Xre/MbcA/ParS toxin-binding domain-containing protein [Kofleriaceae bacterium]|nr:antitoxin Xre/MbcA/ParS toxin-binding domain-containing protein [Kofleriaceae bacterium]
MATCKFCEQRKGKRSCPALGGAICSQCCGQHRLAEIVCPSDCVYLGGLSMIGSPERAASAFTEADYASAWEKLKAHLQGASAFRNAALTRCFDSPEEPAQWEVELAVGYLFYGHRDAGHRRLVDHFLALRGRWLSPGEVAAMMALQRAWASLFEVVSVQTGTGMELRDLLSGETVRVRDVTASSQARKWDVTFAWLFPVADHIEMTGAACQVPRQHVERVRRAIDDELVNMRVARPGVPDRELIGAVTWVVLHALRAALRELPGPELVTRDGQKLELCRARYAISDERAVRARLAEVPDLEATDAGYTWLRAEADPDGGRTVLGHVRVSTDAVVLETMAHDRLERGKQMLEQALGAMLTHREDTVQPHDAAFGGPGGRSIHARGHVPDREERALIGEYLQGHYGRWIDEPLPALGGATPRETARSPAGRLQVEELVKDIENTSLAMAGGDAVDFTALRRELGLVSGDPTPLTYDAEHAPDPAAWLTLDDAAKARAIEHYHEALGSHPEAANTHMHAVLHVIIENQLAGPELPEVRATLERLTQAGLRRHEAIHAIGSVMADAMHVVVDRRTAFDRAATARALGELQPEPWRF